MSGNWLQRVSAGIFIGLMAQTAMASEEVKTIDTILVTAGRVVESVKNATQSAVVISKEDLEKNSHKSLAQILQGHGVDVNQYTPSSTLPTQIKIRGMRSTLMGDSMTSTVLVLVDGRRVASNNINMIPMASIEQVEIVRGPAAVQYGSTAIGGVINVITKRGSEDTRATIEIGGGSWETWKGVAGVSGKVGDADFALGFSQATMNGDYKSGDGNKYNNTRFNSQTTYNVNMGYNFAEEHRIGMSLIGSVYDKMGDPGSISWPTPDAYTERDNYALDFNYEGGKKSLGLSWKTRYFVSQDKYVYATPSTNYKSEAKGFNQGSQTQLTWDSKNLTLTSGVDWMDNRYRAQEGQDYSRVENIGGFLLAKTKFFDEKLITSFGARYDHYRLSYEGRDNNLDNVSLNAGVAVKPLDWLTFKGNVGESYRVPTGMEVAGYDNGWSKYRGNSNLDPEKGLGWDAGFEVAHKGFNFGITYFSTDYKDKIVTTMLPDYTNQYINLSGTSKYRGIEGQASFDIGQVFDWSFVLKPYVNFTHMLEYEDHKGDDINYVREWNVTWGIGYQHPEWGLDMDLRFTYLGEQKEDNFDTYPTSIIKTGDVVLTDFTVIKTLKEWEDYGTLSIKGEIKNVFDEEYTLTYGYPMPGRSWFMSLCYKY